MIVLSRASLCKYWSLFHVSEHAKLPLGIWYCLHMEIGQTLYKVDRERLIDTFENKKLINASLNLGLASSDRFDNHKDWNG